MKLLISILFLLTIVIVFLLITFTYAHVYGQNTDALQSVDNVEIFDFKRDIAEVFDLGSGVFAAVLFVLSLIAYINLRQKRMLYVSIAFGLFAVRTIVSRSDLFMPEIESSLLEMMLAIMSFVALSLFFIAIVRKEKVVKKGATS